MKYNLRFFLGSIFSLLCLSSVYAFDTVKFVNYDAILNVGFRPTSVASAPDGTAWVAELRNHSLAKVDFYGKITEYNIQAQTGSEGNPMAIAAGADGNYWFCENGKIGYITPAGVIKEMPFVNSKGSAYEPSAFTAAGISGMWVSVTSGTQLALVNYSGAVTSVFPVPNIGILATANDGSAWFIERLSPKIGTLSSTGALQEYELPTHAGESIDVSTLAPGLHGLWFGRKALNASSLNRIGFLSYTGDIQEYPIALPSGSSVDAVAATDDGNVWFEGNGGHYIGKMNTLTHEAIIYTNGSDDLLSFNAAIAPGPNGGAYFVTGQSGITTVTAQGVINTYTGMGSQARPTSIAADPVGKLWFLGGSSLVSRIVSTGGITEYSGMSGSTPFGTPLIAGPHGMWFTEPGNSVVANVSPAGKIMEYPLFRKSAPSGVAVTLDGRIWVTEPGIGNGQIAVMNSDGSALNEIPLPAGFDSPPQHIAVGPDQNLWFSGSCSKQLGRLKASDLSFKPYTLFNCSESVNDLISGPDGNLWIAKSVPGHNTILVVFNPAREEVVRTVPLGGNVVKMTVGPNNNIWFVDDYLNRIGEVSTVEGGPTYTWALPAGETGPEGISRGPGNTLWLAIYDPPRITKVIINDNIFANGFD